MDFLSKTRTLVRIVEAGSFSAAARSSGLSLAAISRQVRSLEQELGVTLLVRTTRSLRLTEEGRRFHDHATRLVRDADAARASVKAAGSVGGYVLVSSSVSLGVLRIVPGVPALLSSYPALSLELRLEDRATDLVSEGVDIAVRAGLALPDTTSVVAQPLATFERAVVASPAYLRRLGTPRSVAALASHAAVLGAGSSGVWRFAVGDENEAVTMSPKLRVGTLIGVREAVVAGVGVAVLPDFVVARDLAEGTLRQCVPHARLAPVHAHALYRTELRGVARIDAIVRHLRESVPLAGRGKSSGR